jgi:hypothetical protein
MSVLDDIVNRKLTRKEFLGTIFLSIMSLLGAGTVAGILSGKGPQREAGDVFGSGLYGGDELLHKNDKQTVDKY